MDSDVKLMLPKWLSRILYGVAAIIVLVALGIGTAWLFIKSPFGEALVMDAIAGTLSRDGDIAVTIADIEGDLPSSITMMGVRAQDSQGNWLTIDRLFVSWRPWSLFSGRVVVNDVVADTVTIHRLPEIADGDDASPPLDLDGLAVLLARLRVEALQVKRVDTFYEIDGQPVSARLDAQLEPDETGRPRLTIDASGLMRGGTLTVSAALGQRQMVVMSAQGSLDGSSFNANGTFNTGTDGLAGKAEATLLPGLLPPIDGVTFTDATFIIDLSGTLDVPEVRVSHTVV